MIHCLSPHVANLIAAGEVVERPASVVKELVENAMDAGATAVTVELANGGMTLLRVTDNGDGIAAEELPTAFLRHATSKLQEAEDLAGIATLGFRGEALAAIAAVSRVDITSRRPGENFGAALHVEGGVPGEIETVGAAEGTAITVRDLFYNTPARLKFMKKDTAESAAIVGLLQHLALSRPDIALRCVKDGTEMLHTPGDGLLSAAIYAALGRDFAGSLLPLSGSGGDIRVEGFITQPLRGRGSRAMQVFFVNGRFIKSQLLTAALEEGYRNQLLKGRFPGCVLLVTLPVTAVDVNVHPAKTTVKFAREHDVFEAVYHTVLDRLDESAAPALPTEKSAPDGTFFKTMDAKTFRETVGETPAKAAPIAHPKPAPLPEKPAEFGTNRLRAVTVSPPPAGWDTEGNGESVVRDWADSDAPTYTTRRDAVAPPEIPPEIPSVPEPIAPPERPPEQLSLPGETRETPWRLVGEVLRTYIICEDGDKNVWLIDKHAAHERVQFDRLKNNPVPVMRQTLLRSLPVELPREDAALLLENLSLLEGLGFLCEEFGADALLVREIPADILAEDAVSALEELAQTLRRGGDPAVRRDAMLATMACKAAIKAGMLSSRAELRILIDRVQAGEIRYCPHGRPVAVKIPPYELEKLFKRA